MKGATKYREDTVRRRTCDRHADERRKGNSDVRKMEARDTSDSCFVPCLVMAHYYIANSSVVLSINIGVCQGAATQ